MLLDGVWRRIPYTPPLSRLWRFSGFGFLSYELALTRAHDFLAQPIGQFPQLCIETRLIEIEFRYEYSTREIGVGAALNMAELRQAMFPPPREDEERGDK